MAANIEIEAFINNVFERCLQSLECPYGCGG